ncbi:hypothetical protein PAAG_11174 [Paracoccidioides lutzii Pb01]|uniref:Uncharacterized protein n=1 Tax=Paracoccidioides lutzii (strain ATCC MYA-826 / Pb01) TaxID=502779 RepID=A0A0A2V2H3_PARBA|nr:hypothetical protein PAAG_11174 [Paracoccidioides lutzii Pb01]KGQ02001.1 hypothetical protein PAAG_11174 [Paracoccidioides lutzii Pb01]
MPAAGSQIIFDTGRVEHNMKPEINLQNNHALPSNLNEVSVQGGEAEEKSSEGLLAPYEGILSACPAQERSPRPSWITGQYGCTALPSVQWWL